jgi:hypothetical protein
MGGFLNEVRQAMRLNDMNLRTEETYISTIRRHI